MDSTNPSTPWDCIVIGGGAAGLSAALVLGRARKRTLLVDAGRQSNAVSTGIGGLLGHDGRPPTELYRIGHDEVTAYPTTVIRRGEVVAGERVDGTFVLTLDDGRTESARRVLLAMGMDYRIPELAGVAERWGHTVFTCPFCHGWEVRDRPLGVLDRGPMGTHRALLLRGWSDDITMYTDGPAELGDDDVARLTAAGVAVDERPTAALVGPGTELTAITFADGSERACGGLLVPATLHQRSPLATMLGAEIAPPGMLSDEAVAIGAMATTNVPGLFAAGDVGALMPSVANAVAAGSNAAAGIVASLVSEDHDMPSPVWPTATSDAA
jgi:thioredoxin reductase